MSLRMSIGRSNIQAAGGRIVAAFVALALGFASLLVLAPAASAATPGISSEIVLNGATYNGKDVVKEGDALSLLVAYNQNLVPGSTVTFELGTAVTLASVPKGNSAIANIKQEGNRLSITFKDPIPVNQGVFELGITVNAVQKSELTRVEWTLDGEQNSVELIITNDGDEFSTVTHGSWKSATVGNLDSFVVVGDDCKVTLKDTISAHKLKYTLKLESTEARKGLVIADTLPAGLGFVTTSFKSTLTKWDGNGLNKTSAAFGFAPVFDGNKFTGTVSVPGNSRLEITYEVTVTDKGLIEKQLSAECAKLKGVAGSFSTTLTNTATFGSVARTAQAKFTGQVAGPGVGTSFVKTASWQKKTAQADSAGRLEPALPITYTLKADLRQWDGRNANFTLTRNVVILDKLPAPATWESTASDFITATGMRFAQTDACVSTDAGGNKIAAVTRDGFAVDAYVGMYCVDGQNLLINVGRSATTNVSIQAKAVLASVAKLPVVTGQTTVTGAVAYQLRNTAEYSYKSKTGSDISSNYNSYPIVLPNGDGGYNDPTIFKKTGPAKKITTDINTSVDVDYNFAVGAGKGIDMRTSTLVDYVDPALFNLGNLETLPISGTYDGQKLTRTHFTVVQNEAGELRIVLSAAGKKIVDTRGADKAFAVKITLTTQVFAGKESKLLKNKATLFGANDVPMYWSETRADSTSYGDEAEVRKSLVDTATGESVETLDALVGDDGQFIRDIFTYRVEFIPHGSYNNVTISDVVDVLPDGVEFLGFVTPENATTAANPTTGPIALNGNIEASYANGTVKLTQKAGTKLVAGQPIESYFAVRATNDFEPIVNAIGGSKATIAPVSTFSITKSVTGVQSQNTAVPQQVVVTASWELNGTPATKELTVLTDGVTATPLGVNLPKGTRVTLQERTLDDVNGISWGAPKWAGVGVVAGEKGTATVTIGSTDAAGVSLENRAGTSVGNVTIAKLLEGEAKDLVTLDGYEVTANISGQPDRIVTVKPGEHTQIDNIPVGATVTFSEAQPVDTDLLTWAEPVISPKSVTVSADHFADPAEVTVTNSVARTVGSFEIVKQVTGAESGNAAVPTAVEVTATWATGSKVLTVPTDGTPVALGEQLYIGTPVTLTEKLPEDGNGIAWSAPIWSGGGVALGSAQDAIVTIGRDSDARVTLENHAATSTAGISLLKQVGGDAANAVDADTEFTVRASWDLGAGVQSKDLTLVAGVPINLGIDLPAGTVVTLEELDLPEITGVQWGTVALSGDGVTQGDGRTAQVTVSTQAGAVELVTVMNEAVWAPGTLNLAKVVTGVPLDHADVPENVTVRAAWVAANGEVSKNILVPTDGTPVPLGESLPYGTQVVLTEVDAGSSTSFTWATPQWAGQDLKVSGVAAEVTIGAASDTAITLTNEAVATTGPLSITKHLSGAGAADVLNGTEFPVTATWTDLQGDEQVRELKLTADQPSIIEDVAFGTEVSLVEGPIPNTGDVKWRSATWESLNDHAVISADGLKAVVTVTGDAGNATSVNLVNEYDAAPSGVSPIVVPEGETPEKPGKNQIPTPVPNLGGNDNGNETPEASGLSQTGMTGIGMLVAAGITLVAAGAWLLRRRRVA